MKHIFLLFALCPAIIAQDNPPQPTDAQRAAWHKESAAIWYSAAQIIFYQVQQKEAEARKESVASSMCPGPGAKMQINTSGEPVCAAVSAPPIAPPTAPTAPAAPAATPTPPSTTTPAPPKPEDK